MLQNKMISLLIVALIILNGCSSNENYTPEGMSQNFYENAVEVLELIDSKMRTAEKLSSSEKQKIDFFFQDHRPKSEKEILVYNALVILYPTYEVNLVSHHNNDVNGRTTSLNIYTEEYEKISKILFLK